MQIPSQCTSALLLLLAGSGCRAFTVEHRGGDFPSNEDPACVDGTATMDCCTDASSAWATTAAELETVVNDQVGFQGISIPVDPGLFQDQAALVLWTESCEATPYDLRVRSFDASPASVDVQLAVTAPQDQGETAGYRPLLVLGTALQHAGKPVTVTAQRR